MQQFSLKWKSPILERSSPRNRTLQERWNKRECLQGGPKKMVNIQSPREVHQAQELGNSGFRNSLKLNRFTRHLHSQTYIKRRKSLRDSQNSWAAWKRFRTTELPRKDTLQPVELLQALNYAPVFQLWWAVTHGDSWGEFLLIRLFESFLFL